MHLILFGVATFVLIQFILVSIIVLAKRTLLPEGDITIDVNGLRKIQTRPGGKLLTTLADHGIFLSSACGGGGSCGQCRCIVREGGGQILPTERSKINIREAKKGMRLSCQVGVKRDLAIEVPRDALESKKWRCTVALQQQRRHLHQGAGPDPAARGGGRFQGRRFRPDRSAAAHAVLRQFRYR